MFSTLHLCYCITMNFTLTLKEIYFKYEVTLLKAAIIFFFCFAPIIIQADYVCADSNISGCTLIFIP